jgi:hypothetical protein
MTLVMHPLQPFLKKFINNIFYIYYYLNISLRHSISKTYFIVLKAKGAKVFMWVFDNLVLVSLKL